MPFIQPAPQLPQPYHADPVLKGFLRRSLPRDVLAELEPSLGAMGDIAIRLQALSLRDRLNEPRHVPFDPWGNRVDRIEVTELWKEAERVAPEAGLVAIPYERRHGAYSRLHQFALVHLFHPSSDIYTCPLAMTDGAARTLLQSGNQSLIQRALPRLTSRNPALFWTSGQWMTESTGGSDVGLSTTEASQDAQGVWRLEGRKWFTSAAASQMALALARPRGNPAGGKGLALFYVETRLEDGSPNGFTVNRLKDKLGTRKLPTAELDLAGMAASPVGGLSQGIRAMAPMLNITRAWNAVTAASFLRRGLMLAQDYARRRFAFGAPLAEHPLHRDTLAGLEAESQGAFQLAFHGAELLGLTEEGTGNAPLHRLLTPLVKLTTAKQAVAGCSELLECFGGAGYVEDTGLPGLLRDAQVLSIWEGTTNVLSLEAMKAMQACGFKTFRAHAEALLQGPRHRILTGPAQAVRDALSRSEAWWAGAGEPGARRFALTLGRTLALALLVRQAQWALDVEEDAAPAQAAVRFAAHGVDVLGTGPMGG
jgi:alkylation response protein AidB-like acyl-CoA dehydrogenase